MNYATGLCLILVLLQHETEARRLFHFGGMLRVPKSDPNTTLPKDEWFQQQLDHFTPTDLRTWKQRYFTNSTFHTPGGPVFLMIGGEGTASPVWMVKGQWINYAEKYKALCFLLEHRYYGESHPTRNLGTKNLQYLSSEQALADVAYFIEGMTVKYELPKDTKWIAFGGSYPGSLASWLRIKYPHLVHAAVSASGPLLATADFSEYFKVVKQDLSMVNPSCVSAVQQANAELGMLLKHPIGQKTVNDIFKLCDPIDTSEKNDMSSLYETLAGNLAGIAQYNGDNRKFEGVDMTLTLDDVCNVMVNESIGPHVHRYSALNNLILNAYDQKCLDYKYSKMVSNMEQVDWHCEAAQGGRQWTYQTCTEFGFYQTSSGSDLFGNEFPVDYFIQQCTDIFGARYNKKQLNNGIKRTNTIYGAYDQKQSRIVYVHGSVDPWHALGITRTVHEDAPAIYISGTAHCANMYPSSPSDPPQLEEARRQIEKLIGDWLTEEK